MIMFVVFDVDKEQQINHGSVTPNAPFCLFSFVYAVMYNIEM